MNVNSMLQNYSNLNDNYSSLICLVESLLDPLEDAELPSNVFFLMFNFIKISGNFKDIKYKF